MRTELATVAGYVGRADAPQVLADRLARRLEEQTRLGAAVKDPVGWLVGRGLAQRQTCGDVRCDEGLRLDTGGACETCADVQADRRERRHRVAAAVDAELPHASDAERQAATERRLHEVVTAQAWARVHEWEQVRARQAAVGKVRAEAAAVQAAAAELATPLASVVLSALRPAVVAPEPEPERVCGLTQADRELRFPLFLLDGAAELEEIRQIAIYRRLLCMPWNLESWDGAPD
ncbi:hypothetical protein GCM10020000_79710 [Streptomyces olivoverticillatus]